MAVWVPKIDGDAGDVAPIVHPVEKAAAAIDVVVAVIRIEALGLCAVAADQRVIEVRSLHLIHAGEGVEADTGRIAAGCRLRDPGAEIDRDGRERLGILNKRMAVAGDGVVAAHAFEIVQRAVLPAEPRIGREGVGLAAAPDPLDVDQRVGADGVAPGDVGHGRCGVEHDIDAVVDGAGRAGDDVVAGHVKIEIVDGLGRAGEGVVALKADELEQAAGARGRDGIVEVRTAHRVHGIDAVGADGARRTNRCRSRPRRQWPWSARCRPEDRPSRRQAPGCRRPWYCHCR